MPNKPSKAQPAPPDGAVEKQKPTMKELHPDLPFLPDTADRPRYEPLPDTVDHLRNRLGTLDVIDLALIELGQDMIDFNHQMDKDQEFRERMKKRSF